MENLHKGEVSTSLISVSEKSESVEKHIQVFKESGDKIKSDIQQIILTEQEKQKDQLSELLEGNATVINDFKEKVDQQLEIYFNNFSGQQMKLLVKIKMFRTNLSLCKVKPIKVSNSSENWKEKGLME